jgi:hypothetical protein
MTTPRDELWPTDYSARRDAARQRLADVPLPPGAIEDSAGEWFAEDGDTLVRVFEYWVRSGEGWDVRVCGLQRGDGSVSHLWRSNSDFTTGNPDAAREFDAACTDAAYELVRLRGDD